MKLSVVGSKTFNDYQLLKNKLDEINKKTPITLIISDDDKNINNFAKKWAKENNIEIKTYNSDIKLNGDRAKLVRNKDIVVNSDKMMCFWNNLSKSKLHFINVADYNEIPYTIVKY